MITRWLFLTLFAAWPALAAVSVTDPQDVAPPQTRQRPNPPTPATPAIRPPTAPTAPVTEPTPEEPGRLRFRQGDRLRGDLLAIRPDGVLEWRHEDALAPLLFQLRNIMQVMLPAQRPPDARRGATLVTLTNGDTLRGELLGLNSEQLTLDTWFAGRLAIQRRMLRHLVTAAGAETLVYEGPQSLEGWQRGGQPEAWQFRKGTLIAQAFGTIGRDVSLPARAVVNFELAWTQQPQLQVGLYARQPAAMPGENGSAGYWLTFLGQNALLQRAYRGEFTQLGAVELRKFPRPGRAQISIFTDAAQKTIALAVDGQVVRSWTDSREFANNGTAITFSSHTGGGHGSRVSQLSVRHWVGELDTHPPVTATTEDIVSLANNDRVAGRLIRIENAVATFEAGPTTLTVPLSRIRRVDFAAQTAERARRLSADVLAGFADGTRVTFALRQLDAAGWQGESENFGAVHFTRGAFREVHFHIYDEDRGEDLELDEE